MKAIIKIFRLNSETALEDYCPENVNFLGFNLNARIGLENEVSADDFQIFVCSADWLHQMRRAGQDVPSGYFLVDFEFDMELIVANIKRYVDDCSGGSWAQIVDQIRKIGNWEYEGYET